MTTPHKTGAKPAHGDDDDEKKPTKPAPAPAATTTPNKAGDHDVKITSSGFSPKDVTVKVGETVVFTNDDSSPRNVTFDHDPIVSEDVAPGAAFRHTVTAAGDHTYHDKNVPAHTGTIKAT